VHQTSGLRPAHLASAISLSCNLSDSSSSFGVELHSRFFASRLYNTVVTDSFPTKSVDTLTVIQRVGQRLTTSYSLLSESVELVFSFSLVINISMSLAYDLFEESLF
jgi:hypothetical protein